MAVERPLRVLIVDDEIPIRLLCRVNLEAEGIEVEEAADGSEGLLLAKSLQPDLILLDVMMPGLDGWSVAQELLGDERTHNIPVIFLTARAELQDRVRGLSEGGMDYITKPFDPMELPGRVRELVARHRQGQSEEMRQQRLAALESLQAFGG